MTLEEIQKLSIEADKRNALLNSTLKDTICQAKESGMHESFIRFLDAYDKYETKNKTPIFFNKGATEEQIVEFENEFNVKIPEVYRKILKFSNGFDAFEACVFFYGIDRNNKHSCMSVTSPKAFHNVYNIDVPEDMDMSDGLLVVGEEFDPAICINLINHEVTVWDHEVSCVCIYGDFYSYLEDCIDNFED